MVRETNLLCLSSLLNPASYEDLILRLCVGSSASELPNLLDFKYHKQFHAVE